MNPYHYHGHDDRLYNLEIVFEHTNGDLTYLCPGCGNTLRLGEDAGISDYPPHRAAQPTTITPALIDDVDAQAIPWLGQAMAELTGVSASSGA
jgi:hypothetical protein